MEKAKEFFQIIDIFIHEEINPIQQSLKAHIELGYNNDIHISPKVLRDIFNRLEYLKNELRELYLNGNGKEQK